MSKQEIVKTIKKYGIVIKKKYGQNFLIDKNIVDNIVNIIQRDKKTGVIEIGPGMGVLTKVLSKKFDRVLSYEIDSSMVQILKDKINESNVKIIEQDFLKANIEQDINDYFIDYDRVVLIANLPYYITSPILLKVLEEAPTIKEIVFMMQKEVADRITSKPRTKDYNSLSVLVQYLTQVQEMFKVAKNCFFPQPDVESSVVYLKRIEDKRKLVQNEAYFLHFNRALFKQRRKTIINNLNQVFNYSKEAIKEIIISCGHKETLRAEELSVEEIIELANFFYQSYN